MGFRASQPRLIGLALAVGACLVTLGTTAAAATLWTSNVGSDSATCGASASPCRSISQAIVNATDGDTIWVGPGHYGDVNGDGTFTGPGDEQPDPNAPGGLEIARGCIVCITKALHIYSTDGAALTVIEANASTGSNSTVMILHDGVDFGAEEHGFTVTGGNTYGVTIVPQLSGRFAGVTQDMKIKGNIDIGDTTAFFMYGHDVRDLCPPGYCVLSARVLVANNRAINNTIGFDFVQNFGTPHFVVRDNEALGAATGFSVKPGYQGFIYVIGANDIEVVNNIAAHGGTGFAANLPGPITYNTALDNSGSGFTVTPGGAQFTHNAAIGNGGPGLIVDTSPDVFTISARTFSTFSANNFFGNDRKRAALYLGPGLDFNPSFNPGPSAHCGVLNWDRWQLEN